VLCFILELFYVNIDHECIQGRLTVSLMQPTLLSSCRAFSPWAGRKWFNPVSRRNKVGVGGIATAFLPSSYQRTRLLHIGKLGLRTLKPNSPCPQSQRNSVVNLYIHIHLYRKKWRIQDLTLRGAWTSRGGKIIELSVDGLSIIPFWSMFWIYF